MPELIQAIRSMTHTVDMLVTLGYTLAGVCVAMLISIISFLVAWQTRQDKKMSENSIDIATLKRELAENTRIINKNIPELFQKWDAIITGCVKPKLESKENADG